jgi:hypothetical protein
MSEMYYLVRPEVNLAPVQKYGPYKDAATAAFWAKKVSLEIHEKVLPRRLSQAGDWRQELREEFAEGLWLKTPKGWDIDPIADHFVHISREDEFMLGYFPKDIDAVMRKPRQIKPGAYLEKFFKDLHAEDKKRLVLTVANEGEIQFATTEDEIQWVYQNGPNSCMAYAMSSGNFNSEIHPTRVYAAGDLAIAYIKNKLGRASERCICWPEKKIFGRIYGAGNDSRIKKILTNMGWKHGNANDFTGARIKRVLEGTYFVVPYIDNSPEHGSGGTRVRDDGDYLVIDHRNGTMSCEGQSGRVRAVIAPPKDIPAPSIKAEIATAVEFEAGVVAMAERLNARVMAIDPGASWERLTSQSIARRVPVTDMELLSILGNEEVANAVATAA